MNINEAIEQAEFLDLQGINGLADFIRKQQAEIEYWKEKFEKAMEIQENVNKRKKR